MPSEGVGGYFGCGVRILLRRVGFDDRGSTLGPSPTSYNEAIQWLMKILTFLEIFMVAESLLFSSQIEKVKKADPP